MRSASSAFATPPMALSTQMIGVRRLAGRHLPVAGLLGAIAVRRERDRLREIDAIAVRRRAATAAATATSAATTAAAESRHAELDLLRPPDALRQVRRLAAVERRLPHIELVIEQHRLSVARPSADAPDRLLVRVIVVLVHVALPGNRRCVERHGLAVLEIERDAPACS